MRKLEARVWPEYVTNAGESLQYCIKLTGFPAQPLIDSVKWTVHRYGYLSTDPVSSKHHSTLHNEIEDVPR